MKIYKKVMAGSMGPILAVLLSTSSVLAADVPTVLNTSAGGAVSVPPGMQGEIPEGMPGDMGEGMGMPDGIPPDGGMPGGKVQDTVVTMKTGNWKFNVITNATTGEQTATITRYLGTEDTIVVVPSVLDGVTVTGIAEQAFARHGELLAIYVPDSVTTIASWAFYDCNSVETISIAGSDVDLDTGAFQSTPNVTVYVAEDYAGASALRNALGDEDKVITTGYEKVEAKLVDETGTDATAKTLVGASGTYFNVTAKNSFSENQIVTTAKDGCNVASVNGYTATLKGEPTGNDQLTVEAVIAESLREELEGIQLNKTFRALTSEEAEALNADIAASNFSSVKTDLNYEAGYYVNGNKVEVSDKVVAYDVETGEVIHTAATSNDQLFDANSTSAYKYIGYKDTDGDGKIDIIYYSPFDLTADENGGSIVDNSNVHLNGMSAQKEMDPVYYTFANSVIKADGTEDNQSYDSLSLDTAVDGDQVEAAANEERSVLWATNYATIDVDHLEANSTAVGNWAKMSYEAGLSDFNVEIIMEWGMNAVLYATQGGTVTVGDTNGETSHITANGDGANGVFAACAGTDVGEEDAKSSTSKVFVYNTDFDLQGWNNHIADCVYGGYAYLEDVTGSTGRKGSYAIGQGSTLANDFGNGVIDAVNVDVEAYGNRSAGMYVIGGGVITAEDSSFTSYMDAGAVIASGGTLEVENSELKGQLGVRNRGGGTGTSTISNSKITAFKDTSAYVTGEKAEAAKAAWEKASGSTTLMHYMMSDATMTIGQLCKNYELSETATTTLLAELSDIAGETYTEDTLLINSVLDNTFYNYSAGAYTGTTDFSEVPYLTVGSSYGGLVNSVLSFEASGTTLNLTNNAYSNMNTPNYNYLAASEAGSTPTINFIDTDDVITGLVWNEGDLTRAVEGRSSSRSSAITTNFINSDFEGSFADGDNGLWEGATTYTNNLGETTKLNGNYYGAEANWGVTASFDANSSWKVTHDSYVGTLTIANIENVSSDEAVTVYYKNLGVGTDATLVDGLTYNNVTYKLVK